MGRFISQLNKKKTTAFQIISCGCFNILTLIFVVSRGKQTTPIWLPSRQTVEKSLPMLPDPGPLVPLHNYLCHPSHLTSGTG